MLTLRCSSLLHAAALASQANENTCITACRPLGRLAISVHVIQGLEALVLQGAAVAAMLCALQQRASRAPPDPTGSGSDAEPWPPLRFAVLCSGFASPCPEHQRLLAAEALLQLPSLHIYGAQRHADRQARSHFGIAIAHSLFLLHTTDGQYKLASAARRRTQACLMSSYA